MSSLLESHTREFFLNAVINTRNMSKSLGSSRPTIRADVAANARPSAFAGISALPISVESRTEIVMPRNPAAGGVYFPRRTLFWLNAAMFLFHSMLAAATLTIGKLDLTIPVFSTNLSFSVTNATGDEDGAPAFELVPVYHRLTTGLPLTWLVASFFFASAIAHVGNITLWRSYYESNLAMCRVPSRFIEYFISAGIMIAILAYNAGIREYTLLIAIVALVSTTMPYGYLTELVAVPCDCDSWTRPASERLAAYWLGNIPQCAAWAIILISFYDQAYTAEAGPPVFVYIIIWSELVVFFSFGAVQLWQQLRPPSSYYKGEIAYQLLSLFAKGLLGLILIFNVLVLSSFDEIFSD